VYYATVDLIKDKNTILIIDEAKRISCRSTVEFPYWDDTKDKKYSASKSDKDAFGYIFNSLLFPLVNRYVIGK
jgi:hypothetical protein